MKTKTSAIPSQKQIRNNKNIEKCSKPRHPQKKKGHSHFSSVQVLGF